MGVMATTCQAPVLEDGWFPEIDFEAHRRLVDERKLFDRVLWEHAERLGFRRPFSIAPFVRF